MPHRAEAVVNLTDSGVVAVIRVADSDHVMPVCEALVRGGIRAIELTATIPNFPAAIRQAHEEFHQQAMVGAGSIISTVQCQAALAAGAEFIVSPILRLSLIPLAHEADRPVIIGAFTPTEAQIAYEHGADFVKIFPAEVLGPGFVRAIRAPLPHLRLVPTGGVTQENAHEYFEAGCPLVGLGSNLITGDILLQKDWKTLTKRAALWVKLVQQIREAQCAAAEQS